MEEILEILGDLHPDVDFENCDSLIDNKILDSYDIVTIISEVEDRLGVVITADKITPANFNSAESIYELVDKLMNDEED